MIKIVERLLVPLPDRFMVIENDKTYMEMSKDEALALYKELYCYFRLKETINEPVTSNAAVYDPTIQSSNTIDEKE